jgi:hypothetical protein
MDRNGPASMKGNQPYPRISSTGVQKPKQSAEVRLSNTSERTFAPVLFTLAPFACSLDWLCVNMSIPEAAPLTHLPWEQLHPIRWWIEEFPDVCYWTAPTQVRTEQFNRKTEIVDAKGVKLASIWFDPHDNRLHSDRWVQVQPSNDALASGEWITILRMMRAMGCEHKGISRIDIACDGIQGDGGDFPKVVQQTMTGNAKYYGHCDWIARHSRGTVYGAEFGTKGSNKFIRAYRKKREMKRKGVKPHIVAMWKAALGWDPMNDPREVNRFEVQLKGKEILRYFPDAKGPRAFDFLASMIDTANRVDVFASMATDMFDFRTPAPRARDARSIVAWDWTRVVKMEPSLSFRAQRNLALSDHTIKVGLHAAWELGTVTSNTALLEAAMVSAMAAGPMYVQWYERSRMMWLRQLVKRQGCGDGRTTDYYRRLADGTVQPPELMTRRDWETQEQFELMSAEMGSRPAPEPETDDDALMFGD